MSSLADLNIPTTSGEKESAPLSEVPVGTKMIIKVTDFKKLGHYDGVVFQLEEPIKDVKGDMWDKVHSSSNRVVGKAKHDNFQGALKVGTVTATVTSGKTDKGTWYDIE
jgi:hypothetical protein